MRRAPGVDGSELLHIQPVVGFFDTEKHLAVDYAPGEVNVMEAGVRGVRQCRHSSNCDFPLPGIQNGAIDCVDELITCLIHVGFLSSGFRLSRLLARHVRMDSTD